MMGDMPQREMTLEEWVGQLPVDHQAKKELIQLEEENAKLLQAVNDKDQELFEAQEENEALRNYIGHTQICPARYEGTDKCMCGFDSLLADTQEQDDV